MKTKLEYTFGDDDRSDFYMITHGEDFYFVLWDFSQEWLRYHLKHNPENLTADQLDILDKTSERFYELMAEHGVNFDEVI